MLTDEVKYERDKLLVELYHNPLKFLKLFKGELYKNFSPLHLQIIELLFTNKIKKQKKLYLAPRNVGKTTLLKLRIIRDIMYYKKKCIVYFSNSETFAEYQTEHIKSILASNEHLKRIYGPVEVKDVDLTGVEDSFSKKAWVAYGRTLILPRGCKQQIRGFSWKGNRPDLVVFDDPEKPEDLLNEKTRQKTLQWILADVEFCINRYDKDWEFIYADTLKHEDATPIHLAEMDSWYSLFLDIEGPNGESMVPELISTEDLLKMKEELTAQGQLPVYYREFRNKRIPTEYALFKAEYFRDYDEQDFNRVWGKDATSIVLADPANTTASGSCDTAIVGASIHKESATIFVRDIDAGKYQPGEIYKKMVDMADRVGSKYLAIETTGPKQWIVVPFQNYLLTTGRMDLTILELKSSKEKEKRIESLIPLYRFGHVRHNPVCTAKLEDQLLSFPYGNKKDICDALAHITDVVSLTGEFFVPSLMGEDGKRNSFKAVGEDWNDDETFYAACREANLV